MSDYQNTPHEMDWDDEIVSDDSFLLLEEGDYNFTVKSFERGRFPGSAKLPACKKAILTLEVQTDKGTVSVQHDLIVCKEMEWKMSAFFRAIGQKKRGEPLRPRWNEVVGSRGRARFKARTYTKKDGSEGRANDVDKFYDFDEEKVETAPGDRHWADGPTTGPTVSQSATVWKQDSMKMPQVTPWGPSLSAAPPTTGPAASQSAAAWDSGKF